MARFNRRFAACVTAALVAAGLCLAGTPVVAQRGQRGAAEYIKLADGILRIVGQLPERGITPDKLNF